MVRNALPGIAWLRMSAVHYEPQIKLTTVLSGISSVSHETLAEDGAIRADRIETRSNSFKCCVVNQGCLTLVISLYIFSSILPEATAHSLNCSVQPSIHALLRLRNCAVVLLELFTKVVCISQIAILSGETLLYFVCIFVYTQMQVSKARKYFRVVRIFDWDIVPRSWPNYYQTEFTVGERRR